MFLLDLLSSKKVTLSYCCVDPSRPGTRSRLADKMPPMAKKSALPGPLMSRTSAIPEQFRRVDISHLSETVKLPPSSSGMLDYSNKPPPPATRPPAPMNPSSSNPSSTSFTKSTPPALDTSHGALSGPVHRPGAPSHKPRPAGSPRFADAVNHTNSMLEKSDPFSTNTSSTNRPQSSPRFRNQAQNFSFNHASQQHQENSQGVLHTKPPEDSKAGFQGDPITTLSVSSNGDEQNASPLLSSPALVSVEASHAIAAATTPKPSPPTTPKPLKRGSSGFSSRSYQDLNVTSPTTESQHSVASPRGSPQAILQHKSSSPAHFAQPKRLHFARPRPGLSKGKSQSKLSSPFFQGNSGDTASDTVSALNQDSTEGSVDPFQSNCTSTKSVDAHAGDQEAHLESATASPHAAKPPPPSAPKPAREASVNSCSSSSTSSATSGGAPGGITPVTKPPPPSAPKPTKPSVTPSSTNSASAVKPPPPSAPKPNLAKQRSLGPKGFAAAGLKSGSLCRQRPAKPDPPSAPKPIQKPDLPSAPKPIQKPDPPSGPKPGPPTAPKPSNPSKKPPPPSAPKPGTANARKPEPPAGPKLIARPSTKPPAPSGPKPSPAIKSGDKPGPSLGPKPSSIASPPPLSTRKTPAAPGVRSPSSRFGRSEGRPRVAKTMAAPASHQQSQNFHTNTTDRERVDSSGSDVNVGVDDFLSSLEQAASPKITSRQRPIPALASTALPPSTGSASGDRSNPAASPTATAARGRSGRRSSTRMVAVVTRTTPFSQTRSPVKPRVRTLKRHCLFILFACLQEIKSHVRACFCASKPASLPQKPEGADVICPFELWATSFSQTRGPVKPIVTHIYTLHVCK